MSRWPPPPVLASSFYKAHGLGNDYLVFEEGREWLATTEAVRRVCDRYEGVGSDGIVVLLRERADGVFRSRMFNPDGSEFERSGNGLRILASYLARSGAGGSPYRVSVGGNQVELTVHGRRGSSYDVSVEMGRARVGPEAVELDPVALDAAGRLAGPNGEALYVVPVSVGNPHLVVRVDEPTDRLLGELGPFLATHPALAHGTNVQLAVPGDTGRLDALIWERGVGRTSASGTSACAVAVAAVSEGWWPAGSLSVDMPGGTLAVSVSPKLDVVLRGPVEEVYTGVLAESVVASIDAR
jgi:diaminopimelate epimerase